MRSENTHENGAGADTPTPISSSISATNESNLYPDGNTETTVPQYLEAATGNHVIALERRAAGYCPLPAAPAFPGEETRRETRMVRSCTTPMAPPKTNPPEQEIVLGETRSNLAELPRKGSE